MFSRIVLSVFLASALLLPTSAFAKEKIDIERLGWYIGINGFSAQNNYGNEISSATNGAVRGQGDGEGLNVRAGYQILSWLAVEGMYEYATGMEGSIRGAGNVFEFSTHNLLANVKLSLPMYWIQPYAILGIGAQRSKFDSKQVNPFVNDDKAWNVVGRPGIGIDFVMWDQFVLNFEAAGMLAESNFNANNGREINKAFYTTIGGGFRYRF